MRKVRLQTFETNSSSTHSLFIGEDSEFSDWQNGKLIFSIDSNRFYSVDMSIEEIEDKYDEDKDSLFTFDEYDEWVSDQGYDYFEENFENIVIFGHYGCNG